MTFFIRSILPAAIAAALAALAPSTAAADALTHPDAQDLGATPPADVVSSSLILKVKHPELLEQFVRLTQEPGRPTFHRFLSVREFAALFAPSPAEIATITRYLNGFGITVTDVMADRLVIHASGTVDAFQRAFTVDMHEFATPQGRRFRRPMHGPQIPLVLRDLVIAVGGFSTEPMFRPNLRSAAALAPAIALPPVVLPQPGSTASGRPGSFTVGDFANQYNVNPLYAAGFDGRGRTVGVVTLANFAPADALAYWNMIGLSVDPGRITQVHVDGGGELSVDADSIETALDVEQAGGVAPGARVVVYDAPNDDQGFIDLFYQAASDNLVDSLSCSWGLAEPFFFAPLRGTDVTNEFTAFHQAFLEAAAQGISVFVASLDNGAFDINHDGFNVSFSNTLSVDHPSDDPAVTAAGGTTLPVVLTAGPGTPDLVVPTEQVWAWDYIENYLVALFGDQFLHAEFPFGTGGGVSVVFDVPWYQKRTSGLRVSEPNQSIVLFPQSPAPQHLLDLPAGFAGRNVPDISANADPETGYLVVSSLDGGLITGFGGTSFVAPQLNGVAALIAQQTGGRLGLWNPMLYRYQRELTGPGAPIVDITAGDNWFYAGVPGYEPGAGLGVLNVANLAAAIARDAR